MHNANYLWNVLKNSSNEIRTDENRIRREPPVSGIFCKFSTANLLKGYFKGQITQWRQKKYELQKKDPCLTNIPSSDEFDPTISIQASCNQVLYCLYFLYYHVKNYSLLSKDWFASKEGSTTYLWMCCWPFTFFSL